MAKLFKVQYIQNGINKVTKYIKADKRSEAIGIGIPYELNGEEQRIDSIEIECCCEMKEILNCTSAG